MKQPGLYVVYAAAVRDATGVQARPGAVLVQDGAVIAAGEPASLPAETVAKAHIVHKPNSLLLPAMVNAHTHLELTDIGPQPYESAGGFVGWVKMLAASRPEEVRTGRTAEADWFVDATKRGIKRALDAGIGAVGDISRYLPVAETRCGSALAGQSYLELFGLGEPFDKVGLELIEQQNEHALQPHAPYSAGPRLFEAASRSGRPVSCHLSETRDELRFVSELDGSFYDFIQLVGKWHEAFAAAYGHGLSPVQWMRPHLEAAADAGGWLVAHCNYVSDDDIAILGDTNTSVAYCPIASEYFGHTDHRYREMLAAGINVCLGTDSIVGTDPNDPQPLGLLSAMRRLYQRDHTSPATLLAMATTHGAKALRMPGEFAKLQPGAAARFACIAIDPNSDADPLVQALTGQNHIEAISFEA